MLEVRKAAAAAIRPLDTASDGFWKAADASARRLARLASTGRRARVLHAAGHVVGVLLLILFAFGIVTLATVVAWGYVAVGVLAVAGASTVFCPIKGRVGRALGLAPVTVSGALLTLLGFNVVWSSIPLWRLPAVWGLLIAGVVITAAVYGYLRYVGASEPARYPTWAVVAGCGAFGLSWATREELPRLELAFVALATTAAIALFLRKTGGSHVRRPLPWALLVSSVLLIAAPMIAEAVKGGRIAVVLVFAGAVAIAITAISLRWQSDGAPAAGRWFAAAGIACVALPPLVLVVVELGSLAPEPRVGRSVPLLGQPVVLSQAAIDHRPIVLFDSGERLRTPLDIEGVMASGAVELCPEGRGLLAECLEVSNARELRNDFGHLRFETQEVADAGVPTTIYVHEVADKLHPGWTDIDYWWYLPDNPANTAQGAMCGNGLVIPEITCFDHQSDWEGVTVVVDDASGKPVAVHYAAHDHIVRVEWSALQAGLARRPLAEYADGRDVEKRPLVFVARGTHAAYPLPCFSRECNGNTAIADNHHDGAHEWPEVPCSPGGCVSPFPRGRKDGSLASWNAFDGRWGSAVCVTATLYCARSKAPRSPGRQSRFKRPWCYDYVLGANLRRPRPAKRPPGCG